MSEILVIGNCAVDVIIGALDDYPPPGGTRTIDRLTLASGGCAVNVAIALGRLGVACDLVTRVGDDRLGAFLLDELAAAGVGTELVVRDRAAPTPVSIVLLDSAGQRSFLHCRGTNDRLDLSDVMRSDFTRYRFAMLSGSMVLGALDGEPTARVLAAARAAGATTLLDTVFIDELATDAWRRRLEPVLPHVDVFLPSFPEAERLTGLDDPPEIAAWLRSRGVRNVIVKIEAGGALVQPESGPATVVDAFAVERVVDSTGAGDAFCAGVLAALARGDDLAAAARLGNAVAHHCIGAEGATAGVPSLDEVLRFLDRRSHRRA